MVQPPTCHRCLAISSDCCAPVKPHQAFSINIYKSPPFQTLSMYQHPKCLQPPSAASLPGQSWYGCPLPDPSRRGRHSSTWPGSVPMQQDRLPPCTHPGWQLGPAPSMQAAPGRSLHPLHSPFTSTHGWLPRCDKRQRRDLSPASDGTSFIPPSPPRLAKKPAEMV